MSERVRRLAVKQLGLPGTVLVAIVLLASSGAGAHTLAPEEIIAQLRTPATREAYGIVEVARLDGLPRLLLVRVGPRWREVPALQRQEVAENWVTTWRHSVPDGIVSIVDAGSGDSLVNFDALGHAHLK